MNKICLLLASGSLITSVASAALVFSDDFSGTPGTAIGGSTADIGGTWAAVKDVNIGAGNTLDTSGGGRELYNSLAATLGAGQKLTVSFDTHQPSNGFLLADNGTGWGGVSMYENFVSTANKGNESFFLGIPNASSWGTGNKDGLTKEGSGDSADENHLVFTYEYDTGKYTFTTANGGYLSGTGDIGVNVNGLRVANGSGGDLNLDNITVDISSIPEPGTIGLVGIFGAAGLIIRRRRFR
ncbi:MAG: PEP-CTERM sorting domain-containing protein [Pontiellaceae bacterium]|nr:PEP-CTERM sorting domain-containing protein [Pontiellaceae bacterium]MBN2785175.1 PEP-CTERM sorting domain-containing protein [Pontiellaceae bacterium]